MSQARVTDFFSQRKKSAAAAPVKAAKPRGGAVVAGDDFACSPSVREEFVRLIDEAAGLSDAASPAVRDAGLLPPSPRTPKRASSEFDLGAAVFSATATAGSADHSAAKRRRRAEGVAGVHAGVPEKATRKRARKKLVLPQDPAQVPVQARPGEATQQPAAPASPASEQQAEKHVGVPTGGSQVAHKSARRQTSKALSKEDIADLKSRLQRIKKHSDEAPVAASSASVPSSPAAAAEPNNVTPNVLKAARPPSSEAKLLRLTVARAKELAGKVQRRKEERGAEEGEQTEPQIQDGAEPPAYQRYHNLAQAAPPGLSLPYQYKVLAEMFRSMDTVVAMLHNRCEAVTFGKVKQGVQDMMHKRFEESHVAQIKTVFPEAYRFRQEKNVPTFTNSVKRGSYQLTMEPVVPSDQNEARPVLSASCLLERRRVFHSNLVSIVKQHHKVFLSSLVPPMSVPDDKLTRWHPRFNVDAAPAVQASSLPQPPHGEKLATAQEVLDKARSLITPKMEAALESLALKTEEEKAAETKEPRIPQNSTVPQTPAAPVPAALRGVSQSLLDRIRAKEAQKLRADMTRNPAQEDRLAMMSRLPELARILRAVFVAEKKPALLMEAACKRMVASYRSALSTGEMEKHVRLLAEVATDWLTVHPVRKDFYLKLNKNIGVNAVVDKLNDRLREERN